MRENLLSLFQNLFRFEGQFFENCEKKSNKEGTVFVRGMRFDVESCVRCSSAEQIFGKSFIQNSQSGVYACLCLFVSVLENELRKFHTNREILDFCHKNL